MFSGECGYCLKIYQGKWGVIHLLPSSTSKAHFASLCKQRAKPAVRPGLIMTQMLHVSNTVLAACVLWDGPGHALQLQSCAGEPGCCLGPNPRCLQPRQGHSQHICPLCASQRGEGWSGSRGSAQLLVSPQRNGLCPMCIDCQLGSSNRNNILLKLFCFPGLLTGS